MVLDLCATCGEEHEPPRGSKCKRTKLKRVKSELQSSGDENASPEAKTPGVEATPSTSTVSSSTATRPPPRLEDRRGVEAYEEDEEERALRAELAARNRERRKKELRAALEEEDRKPVREEEESTSVKGESKSKSDKKSKKKKSSGKDSGDESSSGSDPSSSSSDSDSDSRSRSRSRRRRRRRGRFSISKYTKDEKRVKHLTVIELIYAALLWVIRRGKHVGMEYDDLSRYVGHVAFMCRHASTGTYSDKAFRGYDKAIRDKAKSKGLKAFRMGDTELSMLHFTLDNTRAVKEVRKPSGQSYSSKTYEVGKKVCYAFNYSKDGCTARNCDYEHKCIICKTSDHSIETCKRRKY